MRRIAWTAVAVVAFSAPSAALAAPPVPSLTVTGAGMVERAPDRAVINLAITTNDDRAAVATSGNNTAYAALHAKLLSLGVAEADLRTVSYSVNFNPRPAQPNPNFAQRYGYVVTRAVSVTTDRTDAVGPLIDAAVGAGATDINGVSFVLRDERAAEHAAFADAVADAASQAQTIAAAAHLHLGRIVNIAAGAVAPPLRTFGQVTLRAANSAFQPAPTDIQPPSSLSVHEQVTVVYELVP
jgi:uncharacterized protein YggE